LNGSATIVALGKTTQQDMSKLIDLAFDTATGVKMNVNIADGIQKDLNNGIILSDAPKPIFIDGAVGSTTIIDTTGYESIGITTLAAAGTITTSNDMVTWSALTGAPVVIGAYVTAVTAGASFTFPCLARYIKITLTTAGSATAYLRQQTWSGSYTTSVPTATASNNLAQISATTVVSGGVAGTLAVGGNIAVGAAQTNNPIVVGGVDPNALTRRVLTDALGRISVTGTGGTTGGTNVKDFLNLPAINTQDSSKTDDGYTQLDILQLILTELRIMNQYLYEEPYRLNQGLPVVDTPEQLRVDNTLFTI